MNQTPSIPPHLVTLLPGDGIGPEVAAATQEVLKAAGVSIQWDVQEIGADAAARTGDPLPPATVEAIRRSRVALKGPTATPIGKGFRSVNVSLRKQLDLYANLRPIRSLPGVEPRFEGTDIVLVRENTEGLYTGVEFTLLPGVTQAIKLITEPCCRRICTFAFQYAEANGRKRVTVVHKANIMKVTDGLLLDTFYNVAKEHPSIAADDIIVDACSMQMVKNPNKLDVLVTENLYGDILSDLGAGLVGGLGIVPGANLGVDCAVFEAVHGSAPDIAGKGVANPTALLQSAVMMLRHLGEQEAARRIEQALTQVFAAREVLPRDLGGVATTAEFTQAICRTLV